MFAQPKTQKTQPDSSMRVQTSIAGKAVALGWGKARLAGNLLWYGDFKATQTAAAGGKGGGGKAGSGQYSYSASVVIGLCEGPIAAFGQIWNNSTPTTLASLSLSGLVGSYSASAWSYLTSAYPAQALAYRGLANAVAAGMPLGSSSSLPNITFELLFGVNGAIVGLPDADPAAVMTDFLTNSAYGAGFPSANLDSLTVWSNYCIANGLLVSPVLTDQQEGRQFLADLLAATNAEAVWSSGVLTVVPYGDQSITANGRSYTAPSAPLYSLTDIDFKDPQGGNSNSMGGTSTDPVQCTRLRPSDQRNSFAVEYLDRANSYNATVVTASDDASIQLYGLRRADTKTLHLFCNQAAALLSAQLMLGREAVRNTYAFTLGPEYILLDPMDIVAITDAGLGLAAQWVRIKEIQENADGTLSIQAEDMLTGAGSAPLYAAQPAMGAGANMNATPTGVTAPVIWEPTYALAEGTEIWISVASSGANFGGADIWVSTDNTTYQLAGTFHGESRMGVTTASLPSVSAAPTGPTVDATNSLAVDMAESATQLISGTQADALAGNTLAYVNGEYLAFQTATLTSGTAYSLSYLVRGMFGSSPVGAPSGSQFVRLSPGTYFRYPITADRIGSPLWFKVLPFNAYGGGQPALSAVAAYGYTVTGVALAGTLAAPANLTTSYVAAYTYLTWTEVSDFRVPQYEIRKGSSWAGGQKLGTVAHPPFLVFGNDTYWVAAVATPTAGLTVYSTPVSLTISGAAIVANTLATWDEAATSWTGTRTGGVVVGSGIVTTSDLGAGQVGGVYEIPTGHQIDVGRACACNVLINWTSSGYPAGQNVLATTNWLAMTDLLGAAAAQSASVYPEIAISQDGTTWGAWQRFVPGAYVGRKFKARMQVQTLDPQVAAALLSFTFAVAPPQRDDHIIGLSVASGGTAVTFKPDGSGTTVAFNGGPGGAATPAVQGTIIGASGADTLVISSLTTSGCTVQVLNGGSGVARTVNLLAQGY